MDRVNEVRTAILETLKLEKVYLLYMDEVKQVHLHLILRYDKKGIDLFDSKPGEIEDFKLDDKIRKNLEVIIDPLRRF